MALSGVEYRHTIVIMLSTSKTADERNQWAMMRHLNAQKMRVGIAPPSGKPTVNSRLNTLDIHNKAKFLATMILTINQQGQATEEAVCSNK